MESHPKKQIIGDVSQMVTHNSLKIICGWSIILSQTEPKNGDKALNDENLCLPI